MRAQANCLQARQGQGAEVLPEQLPQPPQGLWVQPWGHSRPLLSQGWQAEALAEVLTPAMF